MLCTVPERHLLLLQGVRGETGDRYDSTAKSQEHCVGPLPFGYCSGMRQPHRPHRTAGRALAGLRQARYGPRHGEW